MKILKSIAPSAAREYAEHKFNVLIDKKKKELSAAADALYDIIFPDKDIIQNLPEPFFTCGTRVALWVGNAYCHLEVSSTKRFPHNGIRIKKEDISFSAGKTFLGIESEYRNLLQDCNKFRDEILVFIRQFTTVEKLAGADEALAGFYLRALPAHERNTPAITVASIIEKYPTLKEAV